MSTPGPTSTRTRVRAVHHLNDEPQSGTPCRMGPQSREGLHSVLIFMRRFWQQFTHGGNCKQNSGCEWISATNQFCPKPELAIVGKKCCGLRQSGGVGEVAEPQLFRGDAICSSKWRVRSRLKKSSTCQETCLSHKIPLVQVLALFLNDERKNPVGTRPRGRGPAGWVAGILASWYESPACLALVVSRA